MNKLAKQNAKTFGEWAYLAIAKHFSKILKHEVGVLEDKDPEELHQMRVGMRRLRSAIAGFSDSLDLPKSVTEKKVGKVARILGELRDIDVLGEALKNQYQPVLPKKEKKKLNEALEVLKTKREEAFDNVKTILEDKLYETLKQAFKDWLEEPKYQKISQVHIQTVLPELLLPQASKLLLHPAWLVGLEFEEGETKFPDKLAKKEVEKLLEEQGSVLHELRKEAKRSRYSMELFTQFYGDNYQNYLNDIKEIQSILGEIQDCFVLAEFMSEAFESDITNQMPKLAEKLTDTRYKSWQKWAKLQRKFLDTSMRQNLHLAILNPHATASEAEEN
ncbi:MAG: CHAD domain-containing protein [Microcystaceae cyanobacterium]